MGHPWWGIAGALAIELVRNLVNLHQFDHWLRNRNRRDPPDAGGLWGDLVSQVSRLHRRKQFHKKRLLSLFRELRRSTASMPDGVVALNSANEIVWFNRKAAELLGLKRKTDFGIQIAGLLRVPEFSRYLAKGDYSASLRVPPRVGDATTLEFQGVPYGEGQVFLLVRDVTRQSQLETMRKDFVANASHELRSPLTVIAGYLETLALDEDLPADLRPPLLEMRRQAEEVEVVHAVYVIDDHDILLGSLSLKKLLTTGARTPIADVYDRSVRSVTSTTDEVEVARIMKKYDLFVVPVVDDMGRLLGRITIDDIVDVIQDEADSNYQLMSGLSDEVEAGDGLFEMTRARLPCLMVGLVGGILTSTVVGRNEGELALLPQLAFFMPLIGAMGGNVGVQSSAIVVQGLANSNMPGTLWSRLSRELGVGLLNGLLCALAILAYSWAVGHGLLFAVAVGVSLLSVIIFASLFGTAVPWALNHYGIDPALATGPFITTTNDILGLSIYFAIANALLG
mgnify:CR=1 FL=1